MARIQHSSSKKNRLVEIIQAGKTISEAAKLSGIPYRTVKKVWAKFRKTGSTSNRSRSGRPSKVTDRTRRELIRMARNNRKMLFQKMETLVKPQLSMSTVRDHLAKENYHRKVA